MRNTDREYLKIIENPGDLVVITNSDYEIIYANKSYCLLFNETLQDMEGTRIFTRVFSTDIERVKVNLAILTPANSTISFQEELLIEDKAIWVDWNVKGFFDNNGALREIIGSGRNITEGKENENTLDLFKYSLMYARVGTYWLNESKELHYVNDYGCKMLGYSREQMNEFNWEDIIPDSYQENKEIFWQEVQNEDFKKYDTELMRKSGEKLLVEILIHHQEFSGVNYKFVFINDISERKQLMEKLESNEIKFRSLFENSPISLWEEDFSELKRYLDNLPFETPKNLKSYFDENPEELFKCAEMVKVIRVNTKTVEMFEANSNHEFMISLNKIFTEYSTKTMQDEICWLYSNKGSFVAETEELTFNGNLMNVEITVNIAPGYEKDWEKIYVAIVDITKRKKVENELRMHRDHLAELVEEKTAEIQKKYNELNHQFSVMVNREFRIKELRDEIKELKEKLDIFENLH
ncbi:MAG: PAS domain S-box protein [Candidatus Stygibacter australis]|nr:PAS domain S-box protein [Candidatus Stygibacter australis]MDP8321027.1 PAS domain S-box protein [Candidatus Stygibacter australis]